MSEKEIDNHCRDLGTGKDSQYRTAETTLVQLLGKASAGQTYNPTSSNLQSALQR